MVKMNAAFEKILSCILATAMIFALIPPANVSASSESDPSINLGTATLSDGKYSFANTAVGGDNIRTILISFSNDVTAGDQIFLPDTPEGFSVSPSSASNDYTKRINLAEGVTSGDVQAYLRGVGFTIASETQSVEVTISTEDIQYDTFYNIDTEHHYQYIPDTDSSWIEAYNSARGMSYMGRTGYLATIMSQKEDSFVNSLSGGLAGRYYYE